MNKSLRWVLFFVAFISGAWHLSAQNSIARQWNELLLQGIREDFARPPVQARNLFHISVVMYDAWAAYDTTGNAEPFFLGKKWGNYTCQYDGTPIPADIEAARHKAISYAAYRLLVRRFQYSPNAFVTITRFNNFMAQLGYDTNFFDTDYTTGEPAALGNYLAFCMIFFSQQDGSNEQNNYATTNYFPVNPPLNMTNSGNNTMVDPNRWQPLNLPGAVDQNGNPIPAIQIFQSPEWGRVTPFALTAADKDTLVRNNTNYYVYHNPGAPPSLDTNANGDPSEAYKWHYAMVSAWGSHLDPDDGVMWDISPASIGNNTTPYPTTLEEYKSFYNFEQGGAAGSGRPLNPKTGQPYAPQVVPRGDYTRVLAQFWADGPNSETPPGHWFTIFNKVLDHPEFVRKFNGKGEVLGALEYDVKAYFALGGALHDAAISAWGIKGYYDNGRPITNLRYMARKGQSSDPALPRYHPAGVPLIPGYIEMVQAGDPLEGPNGININKIKLYTWAGFDQIANPAVDYAGAGWVLADNWWPYQRKTFVTPPFAGFISGHSTYSRAAAEALTMVTGDEYFPGGMGEFHINANAGFLVLEQGPSVDVTLQWATYRDASDQTSLSRIWGSIHPAFDDIPGRIIGAQCGTAAFNSARELFYNDQDEDGFYSFEDCDDHNAAVYPGAAEICDELDNDCDGTIDFGVPNTTYYADADGDGFGTDSVSLVSCLPDAPAGYVTNALDCDDNNIDIHPGAAELCDGVDNDCSGIADDGLIFHIYYADADGDNFGATLSTITTCADTIPAGYVVESADCDDSNPAIYPGAPEVCDGFDNNCSGVADEGLPLYTFYQDLDADGYGDVSFVFTSCIEDQPIGYSADGGDCNDLNPSVYPGAAEVCDDEDNDCNGLVDEALPVYTYYTDGDGDGFGNPELSVMSCLTPAPFTYVDNGLDCDDDDPEIYPGQEETFGDDVDNNCDGLVDSISATQIPLLLANAYPNPVYDWLTVQADISGEMDVVLCHVNGALVRQGSIQFAGGKAQISFEKELPGVYLLKMTNRAKNKAILLRVVKF